MDPVTLYRTVLASVVNDSITLISIGLLTNLAALLKSPPDTTSSLTGADLISSKVAELVVMGGTYPSGWEYNFAGADPEIAHAVLSNWPRNVPITYSGAELGSQIWSGQDLAQHAPADSPILAAYQWYGNRCNTTLKSYDPVTVLYGVLGMEDWSSLGLRPMFEYANADGYNNIDIDDGTNVWVEDAEVSNQHWLELAADFEVSDMERLLNRLLAQSVELKGCLIDGGSPDNPHHQTRSFDQQVQLNLQ